MTALVIYEEVMRKIHLLEDSVINKIAAGEVVERPASVVKELVENALDAGAGEIRVELEDGGRRRITVVDNGPGMRPEEVALAVTRHATSKITSVDDLVSASTMGFRGEALASISSVSDFTLLTREPHGTSATRLVIRGGSAPVITTEAGGVSGTSVHVERLFNNVPARLKFLRTAAAEYAACLELMQAIALARPEVGFTLLHNSKETLRAIPETGTQDEAPGEGAMRQRVASVLGSAVAKELVFVTRTSAHGHIRALLSPPGLDRGNAKMIHTVVNGRWVKDKTLRYGILRGYHSHLMAGKFPIVLLHLTLDPALVDVNVHPAKTEVRFQYGSEIQGEVALAIRSALRQGAWVGGDAFASDSSGPQPLSQSLSMETPSSPLGARGFTEASGPKASSWTSSRSSRMSCSLGSSTPGIPGIPGMHSVSTRRYEAPSGPLLFSEFEPTPKSDNSTLSGISVDTDMPAWGSLEYVGAFSRCFLFFADRDRMLVVDQHAFHERIIFERLLRDKSLLERSQPLLVPESVEVDSIGAERLRMRAADLAKVGFNYTLVGATTVEINAIPTLLAGRDLQSIFAALADPDGSEVPTENAAGLAQNLLATIACHSAVRAGEDLGPDELKQLLREAATVDFFHNCPHGRRVFRWWSRAQVAAWFDR